jgi:hypothetical protein
MTRRVYQGGPPVVSRLTLLQAFKEADQAWMVEVVSVFGERDARMARFQERANGEPGTRLRELYNLFVAARTAYDTAS